MKNARNPADIFGPIKFWEGKQMQIFKKPVKKEGLNSLIILRNHVYGISFFDFGSKYVDQPEEYVIEKNIKFSCSGVLPHYFAHSPDVKVLKSIASSALVFFAVCIPPYDEPLYGLEEINQAVSDIQRLGVGRETYICKICLNKSQSLGLQFSVEQEIVELYYKCGYPGAAIDRLIEFMNRVIGVDLPGEYFPNYNFNERLKIAAHINQENFNFGAPRVDAIPKYEIVGGRPAIL